MIFESHAHYDDPRYDADREELLNSFRANGVDYVLNVGADLPSSAESVKLAAQYDFIYAAVGVHPHDADTLSEDGLHELEKLCGMPKVVAFGEIGLDFFYDNSPRDIQRHWFRKQLELAERLGLPVIIHSREAAAETFGIIKDSHVRRGVIHCYSGGVPMALDYMNMGFYVGVGGVITFEKAKKLIEVVGAVPLERILLETDAPYLTPAPHRGERNNSNFLPLIASKISEIKGITLQYVYNVTYSSAVKLFNIDLKGKNHK